MAFALRLLVFRDLSVSLLIWNTWLIGAGSLALITERFTFLYKALDTAAGSADGELAASVMRTALDLITSVGVPLLVGGTAFLAATGFAIYYWTTTSGSSEDVSRTESVLRAKAVAYAVGFVAFAGVLLNWFLLPLMDLVRSAMQLLASAL